MSAWSAWTPFHITSPVFLIVLLGYVLRRTGHIDEAFIATSSRLVFTITLPLLMFLAIANSSLEITSHRALILFSAAAACMTPVCAYLWGRFAYAGAIDTGAFVQASFRSNLGIIGIALCIAAFGAEGAVLGALVLAVVTPIYNVAAVLALNHGTGRGIGNTALTVVRNPLILAIAVAFGFQWAEITVSGPVLTAGEWVARMTLPLALLGIGGSLAGQLRSGLDAATLHAVSLKLAILPAMVAACAAIVGFRGAELGVIVLMFASPTAAAAFAMAKAMRADENLTARVIALSTLGSLITLSGFLYVLFDFALV